METDFEALFREHYSRMLRYALDFLGDEQEARDVVMELFGDIWSDYSNWHINNTQAFLYTAVRNRCINLLKQQARKRQAMHDYMERCRLLSSQPPEEHNRRIEQLEFAIRKLPDKTRQILTLCYAERLKYKEAAEEMGTTPGMIHKHISKALAQLRTLFADFDKKEGT